MGGSISEASNEYRKLKRLGCGALSCLALIAAFFLFAEVAVERRMERLHAQAVSMGMYLSSLPEVTNEKAEGIRAQIRSLALAKKLEPLGLSIFSEDPIELRKIRPVISDQIELAFTLSEQPGLGRDQTTGFADISFAIEALGVEGNFGITEKNLDTVLRASAAIRRIAHMLPIEGWLKPYLFVSFARPYAELLQRAVETFEQPGDVDAVIAEFKKWEIKDLRYSAAYLVSDAFQQIEAPRMPRARFVDNVRYKFYHSPPVIARMKADALQDSIEIFSNWQNHAKLLDAPTVKAYGTIGFTAYQIKLAEIELLSRMNALWAKLIAHRRVAGGWSWPDIEELEGEGVFRSEPVTGRPFAWRPFDGKLRVYGYFLERDAYAPRFGILSPAEKLRMRAFAPP